MVILGSLVNGLATVFGGVLGLLFKRRMPDSFGDFLMKGLGLCVILVAVQGMVKGGDAVVTVLSIVIGGLIGFAIDIDGWIHRFGDGVQEKIDRAFRGSTALGNFSDGFVSSSLFICIGSMAVLGSLQSGLQLDHSTLFAKAATDMAIVMVMATTLGIGVPFSGIAVFAYEAILSLGASLIAPLLTDAVINEMVCAGSLLLLAIGLNMLKLTDIKVANYLPAAFMPIAVCAVKQYIQGVFGMSMVEIIVLGVALAMDAFAVTISNAFCYRGASRARLFVLPIAFGAFQGLMPLLGFFLGGIIGDIIEAYAGIVTLVILGIIGGNMIKEGVSALRNPEESCSIGSQQLTAGVILMQSVATSIDAFAVGVSLRAVNVDIALSAAIIALTTCACCFVALALGKRFGNVLGDRPQIVGGVVLVLIGLKAMFF